MKKKLFVWKNMKNKRVYFPVDWRYCWCKAINLAINCGYTNAIEWDLCKFVFSLWSSLSSSFWSNGWFFCSFDGGYCDFDTVHCHGTVYFASNLFARISLHKKTEENKFAVAMQFLCAYFSLSSSHYLPKQITLVSFSVSPTITMAH